MLCQEGSGACQHPNNKEASFCVKLFVCMTYKVGCLLSNLLASSSSFIQTLCSYVTRINFLINFSVNILPEYSIFNVSVGRCWLTRQT